MKLNTQFLFAALAAVSLMAPACGGDTTKKDEKKVETKTETKTEVKVEKTEDKTKDAPHTDVKPVDAVVVPAGTAAPATPPPADAK